MLIGYYEISQKNIYFNKYLQGGYFTCQYMATYPNGNYSRNFVLPYFGDNEDF